MLRRRERCGMLAGCTLRTVTSNGQAGEQIVTAHKGRDGSTKDKAFMSVCVRRKKVQRFGHD